MTEITQRLLSLLRYVFISLTVASVSASVIIGMADEIKGRIKAQNSLLMLENPPAKDEIVSELIYDEIYIESEQTRREQFESDSEYESQPLSADDSEKQYDAKQIKFEQVDLSAPPLSLINQTSYSPNLLSLMENDHSSVSVMHTSHSENNINSLPLVLIYHTHATESFNENGESSYRSNDKSKNIVAVGRVLSDALNEAGIPTLHCETLHDAENFNAAYTNSGATVREYLEKYPSIKYVFDVHRDGLERADGTVLVPISTTYGIESAQIMIVVGSDENGADHPTWQDNLATALMLQKQLHSIDPSSVRAINLRASSFNQQCSPGALLLEIGSNGNTLKQAKNAALLCAKALAEVIKQKEPAIF